MIWGDQSDFHGPLTQEETDRQDRQMQEYQIACRRQAGMNLRKAVSQLPRLTNLTLSHVRFMEPSLDIVALHPYSQLE